MQIDRVIKGEKFRYHIQLLPNTMTAIVRWWSVDEGVLCNITEDFKYIVTPDSLTQYISGVGPVKVGKLKLNKRQQYDAKDYNENYIKN